MAEDRPKQPYMKFLALNLNFSSLSPNPLRSRKVAQAGIKEGYLSKKWLSVVGLSSVKKVANRHGHAAYHNKH